mmetsp:Transcript_22004/g.48638  ORF Transcript_22004/g.48638 Transcript_22004/m.48638 type:complete len:260 (-) Transcript_22004:72-851(-)
MGRLDSEPLGAVLKLGSVLFVGLVFLKGWRWLTALGAALAAGSAAWLLERLTRFEHQFPVVYVAPGQAAAANGASKDSDADEGSYKEVTAEGCRIRELMATASRLNSHLSERGLIKIECPLFLEQEKEWALYGRPPGPRKGRENAVGSRLAGVPLCGVCVIAPEDLTWRPQGYGKWDWMGGTAKERIKIEAVRCTVSLNSVLGVLRATRSKAPLLGAEPVAEPGEASPKYSEEVETTLSDSAPPPTAERRTPHETENCD